jgi:hypothetical protein
MSRNYRLMHIIAECNIDIDNISLVYLTLMEHLSSRDI